MLFMFNNVKSVVLYGVLFSCLMVFSGCDLGRNSTQMDRDANLEIQDFRDALKPRELQEDELDKLAKFESDDSIPDFDSYIIEPSEYDKPSPLVSVSVNQTIPLREVLFELAKQADVDIELDPNIRGSIILTARNKPFDVVIRRISNMAGLRYQVEDGILRIENDYPYQKTYQLEYINILRNSEANVTTSIRIGGSSGEGTNGETDTGSDFSLNTTSNGDFWTEMEENIAHILTEDFELSLLKTVDDPSISVSAPSASSNVFPLDGDGDAGNRDIPQARLNVQSLPTSGTSSVTPTRRTGGGGGGGAQPSFTPTFSVNQQSGIITVYASERLHKKVEEFLVRIKRLITSQVLIEAKVLEVDLVDEFSTGINWNAVLDNTGDTVGGLSFLNGGSARPTFDPEALNNFNFTAAVEDVSVFVDALSRFGTVRGLASPRITVLNNQPAILNVTESRVYFEIEIETEEEDGDGGAADDTSVEITSETFSVPEGVLINVHPSIDNEEQTVILSLKPTVTRVVNFVENPATAAAVAIAQSETTIPLGELQTSVPELSVQEFDSIIQLNSGEVAVLGGLLEDRITSEREGVPILGEVPLLGNLFRTQGDRISKSELVILIKTTILDSPKDSIQDTDRELYKKFSGDRRPFKF